MKAFNVFPRRDSIQAPLFCLSTSHCCREEGEAREREREKIGVNKTKGKSVVNVIFSEHNMFLNNYLIRMKK